jgi:hypothetical protein
MKKLVILLVALFLPGLARAQVINCPNGFTATGGCGVGNNSHSQSFWLGGNAAGQSFNTFGSTPQQILFMASGSDHLVNSLQYQTPVNVQAFNTTYTFVPDGGDLSITFNNTTNQPGYEGNGFAQGAGGEGGFYQGGGVPVQPNNVFALELDQFDGLLPGDEGTSSFTYSSTQIYQSNLPSSVYPNIYIQCPCTGGIGDPNLCGTPADTPGENDAYFQIAKISTYPVPLNSPASTTDTTTGDTYSVNLVYNGSSLTENLYDVTAGGSCPGSSCFTHTWTNLSIPSSVGGNMAYVGFVTSSGSGGGEIPNANLYLNSFVYTAGTQTSTPTPTVTPTPTLTPTVTSTPIVTPTPTPQSLAFMSPAQGAAVSGTITVNIAVAGYPNDYTKIYLPNGPVNGNCAIGTYDTAWSGGGTPFGNAGAGCSLYGVTSFTYDTTLVSNGDSGFFVQVINSNGGADASASVEFTVNNDAERP